MNTFGQNFNLTKVLNSDSSAKRKTKIICTLGPSSSSVETICQMLDAGMNVARIAYCYELEKFYETAITNLRQAFKLRSHLLCAIMLDTRGPDMRTSVLKDDKPVDLKKGQRLTILDEQPEYLGDESTIGCSAALSKKIKVGQAILIQDSAIFTHVVEVLDGSIVVEVEKDATL